ncbi:tRNA uridine-5-carboxymethylaminomethyl(34) synthesis GTPase MnmE [Pseudoxanthomonas broegbernensis]|uniref:tRNA modification GTPase MnmE n=1 Tax=Pseudoxanthomonas broegbernensis TaxID=83619 RepID=A0A7V8K7P6_9GAMM|nr:tRNA uridine-5-carboxymethylaminomethyl(34) synthesis GTPase MnmE [Pseudoxanthomonas broegbernensis]KAF1686838.1 tRNA uridine-5-carboxymethylaminomethyl(34) synthesis GTPase MnmE [Pseudoxanthomonas broegbernensis]MBB6065576.1 tRNA modification GTPase [Pseudoxanthomonas broegbernensis]
MSQTETIAAIATAPGAGGVGLVRLSGPRALEIAATISGRRAVPRRAQRAGFRAADGEAIDDGIVLAFPGPHSFTGEDVAELQAHGSPVLLRRLVERCCELGARPARPGEFSERAFLNGKLDLVQAEAIADLIAAADLRAARAARRSLEGAFSQRVEAIAGTLLRLRIHVEAAIDFVDEPIDTLGLPQVAAELDGLRGQARTLLERAERGRRLRDGLHAVLLGPPNAGKSSLLNALAGDARAIVAEVAGTTRDVLRETVRIDGLELVLADTAGLREGGDAIEREGMRRAHAELARADLALLVVDARDPSADRAALEAAAADVPMRLWIHNKADLLDAGAAPLDAPHAVRVSALTGAGLERLHALLRERAAGGAPDAAEGEFSARARQVDGLRQTLGHADAAAAELGLGRLELAAEELRLAHDTLGAITGRIGADEMLGHIFASFCIGK